MRLLVVGGGIKGRIRHLLRQVVLVVGALLCNSTLFTQEEEKSGPIITLGLGAGVTQQYEGAEEFRPVPFIVARARWGTRMFIGTDGTGLRADIVPSRFIEAGPAMGFRFTRGPNADDPVIALLPEVKRAIELGGFLAFNLPFPVGGNDLDALTFEGSILHDVTGHHDGYTIRVGILYRGLVTKNLVLQLGPFATYASNNFMSAYYDITPAGAAASGLAVFDATSGFKDIGLRINSRYLLTKHWNINGTFAFRHMIGDAGRSPIVSIRGSDYVWFGGFAVAYTF